RGRYAALDRALDEREPALGPGQELERNRLDVLAVDELRHCARDQALCRRRPDERHDSLRRRDRAVPRGSPRPLDAAHARRAAPPPTSAVSPAGTPPIARPTNLVPPQVLGTAQVGQMLTSSVGTWTGSPKKFTYRWRRCQANGTGCVAIPRATQGHYTVTPDDIGSTLSLVVTATGAGGAGSAT